MTAIEASAQKAEAPATTDLAKALAPLDALRIEVFGCQNLSDQPAAKAKTPLEQASMDFERESAKVPLNASDRKVCEADSKLHIEHEKSAIAQFAAGLDKGDPDMTHSGMLMFAGAGDPELRKATRASVDNVLDQRGLGHTWAADGDLSIFKDMGQSATVLSFHAPADDGLRLEKNQQGQVISALPVSSREALQEMNSK